MLSDHCCSFTSVQYKRREHHLNLSCTASILLPRKHARSRGSRMKSLRRSAFIRGTQRIVSVEYLFGRPVIASNFRLGKCHLELS